MNFGLLPSARRRSLRARVVIGLINRRGPWRGVNSAETAVSGQRGRGDLRIVARREVHELGLILDLPFGSRFDARPRVRAVFVYHAPHKARRRLVTFRTYRDSKLLRRDRSQDLRSMSGSALETTLSRSIQVFLSNHHRSLFPPLMRPLWPGINNPNAPGLRLSP